MPDQVWKIVAIEVHANKAAAADAAAAMKLSPRLLQDVEVLEVRKLATLVDARARFTEQQAFTFTHPSNSSWLVIGRK